MFLYPVFFEFAKRTGAEGIKPSKQKFNRGAEADNIWSGDNQNASGF
jgi:hypothetical protein